MSGQRPLYEDTSKAIGWMESLLGRAKKVLSSLEGNGGGSESESVSANEEEEERENRGGVVECCK